MAEKKAKILVVDDEKVVTDSLSRWFGDYGYEMAVAASGREALERLAGSLEDIRKARHEAR